HLILPPNLPQALEKGKVMLCFEGSWTRGRSPLNALPKSESFRLAAKEGKLLDAIEELANGITPPMLMLQSEQFAKLLPMLVDHPRLTLGRSMPVAVKSEPLRIPLRARLESNGELTLEFRQQISPLVRVDPAGTWYFHQNTFQPLGFSNAFAGLF